MLRALVAAALLVLGVGAVAADLRGAFLGAAGLALLGTSVAALRARRSRAWLTGLLALDVVLLTGVLAVSGGASNPFSTLYLVPVVLSATFLSAPVTLALVVASFAGFGLLFLVPDPHAAHAHHGGEALRDHLYGMLVAQALTGLAVGFVLHRVRGLLATAEDMRRAAEEEAARAARLAGLATLAAGAAHELATPLTTILLTARDLPGREPARLVEDAALIAEEVARCRRVLDELSADGQGEAPEPVDLGSFLAAQARTIAPPAEVEADEAVLMLPPRLLGQAVRRLLDNARMAAPEGRVALSGHREGDDLVVVVRDDGVGMSPEVLARANEAFFTRREGGKGRGLGLYFVDTVARGLGGGFTLGSRPGQGTTATLRLPWMEDE